MAETTFTEDTETGKRVQHYQCTSQSYWIPEKVCNARQANGFKACKRCTLRKGGKNDPRPRRK